MIEPPKLSDEDEERRQAALDYSHLLQTNPAPFDTLTTLARSMFGVPIALVSIVTQQEQVFLSHNGIEAERSPRHTSFCGHVLLEPDILVIADALEDLRFKDNPFVIDAPNVRFYAGVPIHVKGEDGRLYVAGSFCVIDSKAREFGSHQQDQLKLLAKAVEREIQLTQKVTRDALTGLLNRNGLLMVGERLLAQAQRGLLLSAGDRNAGKLTALFYDLDGFKAINDHPALGHKVGDRALIDFGKLLQSVNREGSSAVGRKSGDEFIVLMGQADRAAAQKMLQRFDQALAKYNAQETRFQLRYSVGIAEWQKGMTLEQLIHAADEEMYQDKQRRKAS